MRPGNPEALQQPYDPGRVESQLVRPLGGAGCVQAPLRNREDAVRGHDPAAQRDRLAHHGPPARRVDPRPHHPLAAHGRSRDALRARHRPRRHRDPERGREEAQRRGPKRARISDARGSSSEVWEWKEAVRRPDPPAACAGSAPRPTGARERFTLDAGLLARGAARVQDACYEKGLIYRGRYIVNWCPRCRTALSDEEVDHVETRGQLWYIALPDRGRARSSMTVATTRPETMLGDTGGGGESQGPRYAQADRQDARSCRWCAARSRSWPTTWSIPSSAPVR